MDQRDLKDFLENEFEEKLCRPLDKEELYFIKWMANLAEQEKAIQNPSFN